MGVLRKKDPSRKLLKNLTSFPKKYTTKRKSLRTRMNGKIKKKLRRNVLRSRETNAKRCLGKSALKLKGMNAKVCQEKSASRLRGMTAKACLERNVSKLTRKNVKTFLEKIAVMYKNCNAKLSPENLVKWLTRLFVLRNPKQSALKRRNVKLNQRRIAK